MVQRWHRAGPGEMSEVPEGGEHLRQKSSQKHSQRIGSSLVRPAVRALGERVREKYTNININIQI